MANTSSDNPIESLNSRLYRLTWAGDYWGKDSAIWLAKRLFREREKRGERMQALMSLSSTYYSAAGNAAAHACIRHGSIFPNPAMLMWAIRAFLCLKKAERLSDRVQRELGIVGMNHDELGVRSAILCKAGRHREALLCTEQAMMRTGLSPDDQVLLAMGLGEIKSAVGESKDAQYAYSRAAELIPNTKPTTAVRFLKSFAEFLNSQGGGGASNMLEEALEIARANHLDDQVLKIQSLRAYSSL